MHSTRISMLIAIFSSGNRRAALKQKNMKELPDIFISLNRTHHIAKLNAKTHSTFKLGCLHRQRNRGTSVSINVVLLVNLSR